MKHIVYVLTLAFAMMASTALAQTESQLCDQIIIDGKTYPAKSITQKDDATVLSFGDIVTATIPVVHPQDKKTINFADEKGLYMVKGTLTQDLFDKTADFKELTVYGSMNSNEVTMFRGALWMSPIQNSIVKFVDVNATDIDDLTQFLTGLQNTKSVIFENCDFRNVSCLSNAIMFGMFKSFSFKGMGLTNKVKKIDGVLAASQELESIDFSGCDFSNVTDYAGLFSECANLTEVKAIGCNEATVELLRKAIEDNGQTGQVTLITE